MPLQAGDVITGMQAVVRANGKPIAYATGINAQVTWALQSIPAMGSGLAQQLVYTGLAVSFTVETFRLFNQSALVQGIVPRGNTLAMLDFPYLDFEIVERRTGLPIARYLRSKPGSMAMNIANGVVMGQNLTFTACTYGDETAEAIEAPVG